MHHQQCPQQIDEIYQELLPQSPAYAASVAMNPYSSLAMDEKQSTSSFGEIPGRRNQLVGKETTIPRLAPKPTVGMPVPSAEERSKFDGFLQEPLSEYAAAG